MELVVIKFSEVSHEPSTETQVLPDVMCSISVGLREVESRMESTTRNQVIVRWE